MQNRYVGDIGDFGKYALLRALVADDLSLGIVWCLNSLEEGNSDGRLTQYLYNNRFGLAECDPLVFQTLKGVVERERTVRAIQESGIFPKSSFFDEEIMPGTLASRRPGVFEERVRYRHSWHTGALNKTKEADLVFFDPDNGLNADPGKKRTKRAAKYIFIDEIVPFLLRGQSVIVYQHQTRQGALDAQVTKLRGLVAKLAGIHHTFVVTYHRQQVRIYIILASRKHGQKLAKRKKGLLGGPLGASGTFRDANDVC